MQHCTHTSCVIVRSTANHPPILSPTHKTHTRNQKLKTKSTHKKNTQNTQNEKHRKKRGSYNQKVYKVNGSSSSEGLSIIPPPPPPHFSAGPSFRISNQKHPPPEMSQCYPSPIACVCRHADATIFAHATTNSQLLAERSKTRRKKKTYIISIFGRYKKSKTKTSRKKKRHSIPCNN